MRLPTLSHSSQLISRQFHTTEKREFNWSQNPFKALQIHLILMQIKKHWDPSFSTEDFLYGAKNAAVTISWMLQESNWQELRGLLNRKAFKRLQTEVP